MNINKIYLAVCIILILILIPLTLFIISHNTVKKSPIIPSPSPIPSVSQQVKYISIVSTEPRNNSNNIPTDSPIRVDFDRNFDSRKLKIIINPIVDFTTIVSGTSITIAPIKRLEVDKIYTIKINSPEMSSSYVFTFTTSPDIPQGVGPEIEFFQKNQEELRKYSPQAYLANLLPYSEPTFSISSTLDINTGKTTFYVTLKGADKINSKQNLITWMRSQKLTDQQIETFTIVYQ